MDGPPLYGIFWGLFFFGNIGGVLGQNCFHRVQPTTWGEIKALGFAPFQSPSHFGVCLYFVNTPAS